MPKILCAICANVKLARSVYLAGLKGWPDRRIARKYGLESSQVSSHLKGECSRNEDTAQTKFKAQVEELMKDVEQMREMFREHPSSKTSYAYTDLARTAMMALETAAKLKTSHETSREIIARVLRPMTLASSKELIEGMSEFSAVLSPSRQRQLNETIAQYARVLQHEVDWASKAIENLLAGREVKRELETNKKDMRGRK